MKTRKLFALLSALSVMATCSACAGSSGGDSSAAESSAPETTAAPAETTVVTTEAPEPAPVDANAITFDVPSLYGAVPQYDDGAAKVNLDVVTLNGDNKLRVQVLRDDDTKDYDVPKIVFRLADLVGLENTGKVDHFSIDFNCVARGTIVGDEGELFVVGNFLGTLGGNLASQKGYDPEDETKLIQMDWAQQDFSFQDWENPTAYFHFETKSPLLDASRYAANDAGATLQIMRWGQANAVDFYIDNLTLYDADGNSLPVTYDAENNKVELLDDSAEGEGAKSVYVQPTEETGADEQTDGEEQTEETAPAETEAAPAEEAETTTEAAA